MSLDLKLICLCTLTLVGCGQSHAPTYAAPEPQHSQAPAQALPSTTYQSRAGKITVQDQPDNKIQIQSSDSRLDGQTLQKGADDCYHGDGKVKNIKLCRSKQQITITAGDPNDGPAKSEIHMTATKDPDAGVSLEDPGDYSLEDLRARTLQQNFQLREEIHNLLAAKANMRMHYENLLPHLSMNSIVSAVTSLGPLAILGVAGDLVPFLLPNRWAQANEADHLYKAEVLSEQIQREDAVQIVEALAFVAMRDEEALADIKSLRPKYTAAVKLVQGFEASGKLASGRERNVESPLALLDQAINAQGDIVDSDLVELASAVGFTNPLAIRSVKLENFADITVTHTEELSDLEKAATDTSLESQQMAELVKAVKANETERRFDWLDPSGDPQGGLGAGLGSFIDIGKENLKELEANADEVKADVLKRVVEAARNYNSSIGDYNLSTATANLQQARYNAAIKELNDNVNDTPIGDLNDTLTQWPVQRMGILTAKYQWYGAISRLNRLSHQGNFANFPESTDRKSVRPFFGLALKLISNDSLAVPENFYFWNIDVTFPADI